jgi:hypothetical protein
LDDSPFLIPLQFVAFGRILGAFTAAYNKQMLVSGYQSIDIHSIVLLVKFDTRLFISVLRNKQLFKKVEAKSFKKFSIQFSTPTISRKYRPWKKLRRYAQGLPRKTNLV